MNLTTENAHEYEGMKLTGGMFHHYPLTVKRIKDHWMVVDRNGTMMPVPEPSDSLNAITFREAEQEEPHDSLQ